MAVLRLIKESELKRRDVIGSGAFGTVYKVRAPRTCVELLADILTTAAVERCRRSKSGGNSCARML